MFGTMYSVGASEACSPRGFWCIVYSVPSYIVFLPLYPGNVTRSSGVSEARKSAS